MMRDYGVALDALETKLGTKVDFLSRDAVYWKSVRRAVQGFSGEFLTWLKEQRQQALRSAHEDEVARKFDPVPRYGKDVAAKLWVAINKAMDDESCVDNHRFARKGDQPAVRHYHKLKDSGCCGSYDGEIRIGFQTYYFGCNYGH